MRLTTLLLILLILVITTLVSKGQIKIKGNDLKSDTTKVNLLVSVDGLEFERSSIYIITGYEVMEIKSDTVIWFYLGKGKKPLDKRINVWMSKPIEK